MSKMRAESIALLLCADVSFVDDAERGKRLHPCPLMIMRLRWHKPQCVRVGTHVKDGHRRVHDCENFSARRRKSINMIRVHGKHGWGQWLSTSGN